ncbi:PTS sugar transporter subunit IIB [Virgibacillus proomii]|uniref:PTS sugar transporter subunit IIB n=1 Tax=Virgibacillus proomii TaxID=84407 RepID=UPI001C103D3F|nr:PTS sugar transporter subunit IIB [Virgibacillus proomii]MBU5267569.1 PTS sugar transporter subunit IIB [Virgibacillus proomii]
MKTLLIMCGTGVATSTVVTGKIKDWLKENNLENTVKLYQSKISDEINSIDNYDVVISTTIVPDNLKSKVINGVPLLTGVGKEDVFIQLKEKLTN